MTGDESGEYAAEAPPQPDAPVRGAAATGDTAVDRALAPLDGLETRPLAEHHDLLGEAAAELNRILDRDEESGP